MTRKYLVECIKNKEKILQFECADVHSDCKSNTCFASKTTTIYTEYYDTCNNLIATSRMVRSESYSCGILFKEGWYEIWKPIIEITINDDTIELDDILITVREE